MVDLKEQKQNIDSYDVSLNLELIKIRESFLSKLQQSNATQKEIKQLMLILRNHIKTTTNDFLSDIKETFK